MATLARQQCKERYLMTRKVKKIEDKELDTNSDNTHSADTLINILKQLVNQNEIIIQLLTKLKDRFI